MDGITHIPEIYARKDAIRTESTCTVLCFNSRKGRRASRKGFGVVIEAMPSKW